MLTLLFRFNKSGTNLLETYFRLGDLSSVLGLVFVWIRGQDSNSLDMPDAINVLHTMICATSCCTRTLLVCGVAAYRWKKL